MPTRRPARADTGAARVPAAVTRPTRTTFQGGVAYLVLEGIEAFGLYDFTGRQWAWALAVGIVLTSWVQVLLENQFGAGLLRKVPPKDDLVDVPGEGGYVDPRLTFAVALVALVLALLAFFDTTVVLR